MQLIYDGIELRIENFLSWDMHAHYDPTGLDYLFTRYRVVLECTYYSVAAGSPIEWNDEAVDANDGVYGQLRGTDAPPDNYFRAFYQEMIALRKRLLLPRKRLEIVEKNVRAEDAVGAGTRNQEPFVILQVPQKFTPVGADKDRFVSGFPNCDPNNGPKPILCKIFPNYGFNTAKIVYEIEFALNECKTPNILLSNRWRARESTDEHFMITRTISGTAIFRPDIYNLKSPLQGHSYNYWRDIVLPAPLPGYARKGVEIEESDTANSFNYTVTDVGQHSILTRPSISKIEGFHEFSADKPPAELLKIIQSMLPTYRWSFVVRVWGTPASTRGYLKDTCLLAAKAWGFGDVLTNYAPGQSGSFRCDIANYYAEFSASLMFSRDIALIDAGFRLVGETAVARDPWGSTRFADSMRGVTKTWTPGGGWAAGDYTAPPHGAPVGDRGIHPDANGWYFYDLFGQGSREHYRDTIGLNPGIFDYYGTACDQPLPYGAAKKIKPAVAGDLIKVAVGITPPAPEPSLLSSILVPILRANEPTERGP